MDTSQQSATEEGGVPITIEGAVPSISSVTVSDITNHENSPIKVIEISRTVVLNDKEMIWLLLNKPVENISISLDIGNRMLPAERLQIYERLVIFSLPTVVIPEKKSEASSLTKSYKIFLRNGAQQLELPVQLQLNGRCNESGTSNIGEAANKEAQIASLFEFAAGGEPLALIKPLVPLLAASDSDGCNALHLAALNKQNFALKTILSALRECSNEIELRSILNARNTRGQTALHCAVQAGDPDCVHYLLSDGASRNVVDNNLDTVAHYLGEVNNDAVYKEILERGNEGGENGANDNSRNILAKRNRDGYTPAHIAVKKLKLSLLEALIEAGAPVDIPDNDGETPLFTALKMDDVEAASLLAQHSCNVNKVSNDGDTPLKIACRKKNLVMIGRLLDAGSTIESLGTGNEEPAEANDEDVKRILNGERVGLSDMNARNNFEEEQQQTIEYPDQDPASTAVSSDEMSNYRLRTLMKDIVSCLDYLTRLRLAKILDLEDRWIMLADHLGCGHMVEYIRVCLDDTSSPTLMLLNQYEQAPAAHLSATTQLGIHGRNSWSASDTSCE